VAATAWTARDRGLLGVVSAVILIMLLSNTLQHAYPGTVLAMAKPVACLLFLVWLVWTTLVPPRRAALVPDTTGA
jgi:hypothetical protein